MTSDNSKPAPLEIPRDLHDAMVAHCQRESPLECCGILGGISPRVSSIHPLRNDLASETRYNADASRPDRSPHRPAGARRGDSGDLSLASAMGSCAVAKRTWRRTTMGRFRESSSRSAGCRPRCACGELDAGFVPRAAVADCRAGGLQATVVEVARSSSGILDSMHRELPLSHFNG